MLKRHKELSQKSFPQHVHDLYEVHEWNHASAILKADFPVEWNDIVNIVSKFRFDKKDILRPGERKSVIADLIDRTFEKKGWCEKSFDTKLLIDNQERENPTHKIDCYKNRIALEIE